MYFPPDQVAEYDCMRLTVKKVLQLQLFVRDEESAIQWLKQQCTRKPQTFQEIHPHFMKEFGGWEKDEKSLELAVILEQDFLRYDGAGQVPSQIHSYVSSNFKEFHELAKDDPSLRAKGKDRWYVPDPRKASDLEKLRDRALQREFWEYFRAGYHPAKADSTRPYLPGLDPRKQRVPKGKKLKVVRMEAVHVGFRVCWQNRDNTRIIAVARRIPKKVLHEDPKLLIWFDRALARSVEDG